MTVVYRQADDRPSLRVRVSHEQHSAIMRACRREGITLHKWTQRAISKALRARERAEEASDEA